MIENKNKKGIHEWSGDEPDCPEDIVVNAGQQTLIVGSPAVASDANRLDPGDRRQGEFVVGLVGKLPGLQRLRDVPKERRIELEKIRQIRTGERPADWVLEARERGKIGHEPKPIADATTVMSDLQRSAMGMD